MDTKKISIFLEAVKEGSLKKAAEKLNYTQSGLIYLMNTLENELGGVKLLNRTTKGVCLTEEGLILEPFIRSIVDSENLLMNKIDELRQGGTKKLRIGTYPIYACGHLPAVISKFLRKHPENDITIRVATNKELQQLLADDEIDIAIGEWVPGNNVEWMPLMDYQIFAAIPESFPVSSEEKVTFEMLKEYPLLFSHYNQVSNQIEKLLENENPYKIHVNSSDGSAMLRMVGEGLGVAFLASLYLDECPDNVSMKPLDPEIVRTLGIIVKNEKMKTQIVKDFIPYLKQETKKN